MYAIVSRFPLTLRTDTQINTDLYYLAYSLTSVDNPSHIIIFHVDTLLVSLFPLSHSFELLAATLFGYIRESFRLLPV